jgi:lycopene beta-cyclase
MSKALHIIGGGASGLLLARALNAYQRPQTIPIFIHEPNPDHIPSGRWCFWPLKPHNYEHLVTKKWAFGSYVYAHIAFSDFYRDMREWIDTQKNITIIEEFVSDEQLAALAKEAKYCFDARPPSQQPQLWQHFTGWMIQTKEDRFTNADFSLMDFDNPENDEDIAFTYTLPFSKTSVLIEDTHLSVETFSLDLYESRLREKISQKWPGMSSYEIVESETGAIPLYLSPPDAMHNNIYPLGTRAGAIRAATGYGFWHMMQQAEAIALAFAKGDKLPGADPIRPETRWMDKIFMRVLQASPDKAPEYFRILFQKVPQDRLARFLMDGSNWQDRLAIMRALPPGPFLEAAWKK